MKLGTILSFLGTALIGTVFKSFLSYVFDFEIFGKSDEGLKFETLTLKPLDIEIQEKLLILITSRKVDTKIVPTHFSLPLPS